MKIEKKKIPPRQLIIKKQAQLCCLLEGATTLRFFAYKFFSSSIFLQPSEMFIRTQDYTP